MDGYIDDAAGRLLSIGLSKLISKSSAEKESSPEINETQELLRRAQDVLKEQLTPEVVQEALLDLSSLWQTKFEPRINDTLYWLNLDVSHIDTPGTHWYERWNTYPSAAKTLAKMKLKQRRLIDALRPERSENEMRRELDLLRQTLGRFPSPMGTGILPAYKTDMSRSPPYERMAEQQSYDSEVMSRTPPYEREGMAEQQSYDSEVMSRTPTYDSDDMSRPPPHDRYGMSQAPARRYGDVIARSPSQWSSQQVRQSARNQRQQSN
mgnify:CR=1 FL=1